MNENTIELTPKPCPVCDDMGMIPAQTKYNPTDRARECACRANARTQKLLKRAMIPARYAEASLENYETGFPGAHLTQQKALLYVQRYVEDYPVTSKGLGLLLHGSLGTGKTHLAIGIMRELIVRYGVECYFFDQQEFFKQIQLTYNPDSSTTEREVLKPALEGEVLVLDDVGMMKLSDWTSATTSLVLTRRYNAKLTTIVTTNYPVRAALPSNVAAINHEPTLGDRITDRVLSRLQETCIPIEITGPDFRNTVKKARQ
jgi:DNA replication protein DnaC